MSRPLIAGGKPIKRSQLKAAKLKGLKVTSSFAPGTDRGTGKIIKRPEQRKPKASP